MSIVFIKNQSHLKLYKLCRMFLISPVSEPFWSIAAKEAKKLRTGVAMTLAQRAKIVWCKNIVGCKILPGAKHIYLVSGNRYIWCEYSLQPWKREKQRKRAATTLAQRAEAAQQQAPQQHQVKKSGAKKHYLVMWEIVNNRLYSNIRDTGTPSLTTCTLYYLFCSTNITHSFQK